MKRLILVLLLIAVGCDDSKSPPSAATTSEEQPQSLSTEAVTLAGRVFQLEVADEEPERQTGLKHRRSLPGDGGMIFCFPEETPRSFWMRDTLIPLDIIYLDSGGRIVSIKSMQPLDLSSVRSDGPAQFAIELNAGTAKMIGLEAGQQVQLPPSLRTAGR